MKRIIFCSYIPIYRSLPRYPWFAEDTALLRKVIQPDAADFIEPGCMVEWTLRQEANERNLVTLTDPNKAEIVFMQAVFDSWYDRVFPSWASSDDAAVQISAGCLRKPDERMGIPYYECGCDVAANVLRAIVVKPAFEQFLRSRVNSARKVYKFLKDKRKHSVAYWRNEDNWYGFDMGLLLDYWAHDEYRARHIRGVWNNIPSVVSRLIGNTDIPPSSYIAVPEYFRKAYLEAVRNRDQFDGYVFVERQRRVHELIDQYMQEETNAQTTDTEINCG